MTFLVDALHFLGILFLVLVVFNVIILVHEWGHFLAARWRGLKIEKFQIWFGKPIWKKTWNGVQYGLGSIPAGGFVALPQMAPMEAIEGHVEGVEREDLPLIKPLDKIIVAFAGPLFSLLLAFVFAVVVWAVGRPVDESEGTTTIGFILEDMPAASSDLRAGDRILAIDGTPVKKFGGMVDSVQWAIVGSEGDTIRFEVERPGEGRMTIEVDAPSREELEQQRPEVSWWREIFRRPPLRQIGVLPKSTPLVGEILPHSPAAEAGIAPYDFITHVDGEELHHPFELSAHIKANPDAALRLTVRSRGGEPREVEVAPRVPDEGGENPMLGIVWNNAGQRALVHPNPLTQVADSLRTMKNTIGAILSPGSQISVAHLSGPLGISDLYYNLFKEEQGWRLVLWFSVLFNVNLAVLNMLPFPVLDGGHITLALVEAVRRKPLNFKILEVVQMACVLLLFGFMIFVTLKDAGKYLPGEGPPEASQPDRPVFRPGGGSSAAPGQAGSG